MTASRIWRECPSCEGAGEHIVNDTNPYGFGPDPQCDEPVECERCGGEGSILIWEDPLVLLADTRRYRGPWYAKARAKALSGHPLAQLRMIESAIRCDVACRDAVRAWRDAA